MDIKKVFTFKEAAELWGKDASTLRRTIVANNKLIKGIDYRMSGGVWLVTKEGMEKIYGKIKDDNSK